MDNYQQTEVEAYNVRPMRNLQKKSCCPVFTQDGFHQTSIRGKRDTQTQKGGWRKTRRIHQIHQITFQI